AHEEHDRIAAQEHAGHADAEEDRGEAERGTDQHQTLLLASTTAPTMAARSSTDVTSNGTRYTSNSGAATAPTTPRPATAARIVSAPLSAAALRTSAASRSGV